MLVNIFSLEDERTEVTPPAFGVLHKSALLLIWLFIFHNPFPIVESVKEICYYTAAVFFLVLVLTRKIEVRFKTPLAIPFALYTGWVILGVFFALDKPGSLHDLGAHLLKNIWLYYMLCYYFCSKARLVAMGWTFVIAAFIFASVSLPYFYLYLGNSLVTRFGTGFPHAQMNVIGFTTVFASLLSVHLLNGERRTHQRMFLAAAFVVTMAASLLTQSRGTLLSIVPAFFFLVRNKKLYAGIIAALVIFVLISPMRQVLSNPHHYYDRLYPAFFSLEIIRDYPVTGTGYSLDALKNHDYIDPEIYKPRLPAAVKDPQNILPHNMIFILPHSMLLNIPVRTGIPGFGLYLYLLFVFARQSWQLYKNSKDSFIRSWALLCQAAMAMYLTKGAVEPVDTALVEVLLHSIFAMLTITWFLQADAADRVNTPQAGAATARHLPPVDTQPAARTGQPV